MEGQIAYSITTKTVLNYIKENYIIDLDIYKHYIKHIFDILNNLFVNCFSSL